MRFATEEPEILVYFTDSNMEYNEINGRGMFRVAWPCIWTSLQSDFPQLYTTDRPDSARAQTATVSLSMYASSGEQIVPVFTDVTP